MQKGMLGKFKIVYQIFILTNIKLADKKLNRVNIEICC